MAKPMAKSKTSGPIACGDEVKDRITGELGIVTSRTEYLFGPPRLQVETRHVATEAKAPESRWGEENRYEVTKAGAFAP